MYEIDGIAYAGNPKPLLEVTAIRPLEQYRLWAKFNDGAERIYDMKQKLNRPAFLPLQDESVFRDVSILYGAPAWLNGEIDIAPEAIYEGGFTP